MKLKERLITLRIGKGLVSLLALFVMLLTPHESWAEDYDLSVAGIPVTSDNAANVLGEETPTVVFDSETNTLTLNNAQINANDVDVIISGLDHLTIFLVGENYITSYGNSSFVFNKPSAVDEATITITTDGESNGSLTITKDESLLSGEGVTLVYTNVSKSLNGWTHTIDSKLGLKVGGVDVTEFNKGDVMGDETVSYNSTTCTLTLNGANFEGSIYWENPADLTVEILGSNTVDTKHYTFLYGNENANLTLTTNSANPGNLLLTSCYSNEVLGGWNNESDVIYDKESSEGNAIDYDWYFDGYSEEWHIRFNNKYDLWVDGVRLCDAQNEVSFDPENYSGNRITFEDGMLTFNTVAKTTETSPFITNGLSHLTIRLQGENTLNCSQLFLDKKDGDSNHDITFISDEEETGTLVVTTTGGEGDPWYAGHNTPTIRGLAFADEMSNDVRTLTFSEPTPYNLNVSGVTVTNANANAIQNEDSEYISVGEGGSVQFDVETNTLTLHNATLKHGIVSGLDNLTIKFKGTNKVNVDGQDGTWAVQTEASENAISSTVATAVLTFKKDGEGAVELFGKTTAYYSVVSGFASVSYSTGDTQCYLHTSKPSEYDTTDKKLVNVYEGGNIVNATISDETAYPLWFIDSHEQGKQVASTEVTASAVTAGTVAFNPSNNTLSFNGVTIDGKIVSGLGNLAIDIAGANYIVSMDSGSVLRSVNAGALTIKKTGTKASLKLKTDEYDTTIPVIQGFTTLDYSTAGLNLYTNTSSATYGRYLKYDDDGEEYDVYIYGLYNPDATSEWDKAILEATLTTATYYPLVIAGNQVTSENASEITGDNISGTVSFTPAGDAPATLTLDNAFITLLAGSDNPEYVPMEIPCIEYNEAGNLIIKLIGDNTLVNEVGVAAIRNYSEEAGSLTFARGDSQLCSLQMTTTEGQSVIDGFTSILGVNGINDVTGNLMKLESDAAVAYSQEDGLHTVVDNEAEPVTSATIVSFLLDPKFCFSTSANSAIPDGGTSHYTYGEEQTFPVLKRWDDDKMAYLTDLSGFDITYTSSDENVATISETGVITIVGGGWAEIRASIAATDMYEADETWFNVEVRPADPYVSISEGAYFTGQKLTLTRVGLSGSMYYSYGYKETSQRTAYDGEISLPAGEYDFYPYTRCGTDEQNIWSYGNAHRMLYVYDQPTINKNSGEYEGDIEVEITNLPESGSVTVYYYFGDDEENAELHTYTAGDKITVRESTKLNVYLLVEGDSGKTHKTEVIERQYVIKDISLAVTSDDFHNHWTTYYNTNGNVALPENENIGAYIASEIGEHTVTVTQIKSIPRGVPVFLNNETTGTTENNNVTGNLLIHADEDVVVDGDFTYYGLYNGMMKRVHGTISAGNNYLLMPTATQPQGAQQLNIVIDNGIETTISEIEKMRNEGNETYFDLQGRKLSGKPSKEGVYIKNGTKVVLK